jgi:hypothetical protein
MFLGRLFSNNELLFSFVRKEHNVKEIVDDVIRNYLEPITLKSSCWWSNMAKTIQSVNTNSYVEYINAVHTNLFKATESSLSVTPSYDVAGSIATAKSCPAIISLLSTSFLVRSPADIYITVQEDGNFLWNTSNNLITIEHHPPCQFTPDDDKGNLFKGKVNVKFNTGIVIRTSKMPWLFLQPMYHNNADFTVINGVVSNKHAKGRMLNINTFFNIPIGGEPITYHIKKGDVLCYLWFPKKMKMKHTLNNTILEHN